MLALLLGCGLRRSELVHLTMEHLQQREEHWAIIDLVGKGGHVRTVPIPAWVKEAIDIWCHDREHQDWEAVSMCEQDRLDLGPGHHRKSRLVHGSGVRLKGQD